MTEFSVAAANSKSVIEVGRELDLNLKKSDSTEGYAESLVDAFKLAAADPFVRGIFFGALVARNISIKFNDKDGLVITISSLKTLRKFLDQLK
jgi:hypothetical protein